MPRKIKLILNPMSDHGRASRLANALRPIIEEYSQVDWEETKYPAQATELARAAGEQGCDMVLALGGDGTVHEIINGLMQIPQANRPPLGIVPIGSGNDFAQTLGLSLDPPAAARRALEGGTKPLDVGLLRDDGGRSEYWNNTFGVGFDAIVTIRTRKITFVHGFMMYFVAVLQTIALNFTAVPMSVQTESEAWAQPTLMLTLGNGRREGGGFLTTPDARVDDGLLHYATIGKISRLLMIRLIPEVMQGTHGRFKQVRMGSCRKMTIAAGAPLCIHTDGEVFADFGTNVRGLTAEVIPGAVKVVY